MGIEAKDGWSVELISYLLIIPKSENL